MRKIVVTNYHPRLSYLTVMPLLPSIETTIYSNSVVAMVKYQTKDPLFSSRIQAPRANSWVESIHRQAVQDLTSLHPLHPMIKSMTWVSSNPTRRPPKFQIIDWLGKNMTALVKSLKRILNSWAILNAVEVVVKMRKVGSRVSSLKRRGIWRRSRRETPLLLMKSRFRKTQRDKMTISTN